MKKSLFICTFLCSLLIGSAYGSIIPKEELYGDYIIKGEHFNEIKEGCYQKPDCLKGSGALALLFLAYRITINEQQVYYRIDERMIYQVLDLKMPEGEDMNGYEESSKIKATWTYVDSIIKSNVIDPSSDYVEGLTFAITILGKTADGINAVTEVRLGNDIIREEVILSPVTSI